MNSEWKRQKNKKMKKTKGGAKTRRKRKRKHEKKKSYEQREHKNKKILLSWLKHSQMPTVIRDFHVQCYKKRGKNLINLVEIKPLKFSLQIGEIGFWWARGENI